MKSINNFINESTSNENVFEGFFGDLKDIMKDVKDGINAIKESKEIVAQIFSGENLNKIANSIKTELQNLGETKENKEVLRKVLIKILLPEFEKGYEKSKYVKNYYSLDKWREMASEKIDDIFIKK